jgi:hypothetical protein
MRVASGPFPHFELIDEYEAPLLNLQFDEHDFKVVFIQEKAASASTTLQISQKVSQKYFMG